LFFDEFPCCGLLQARYNKINELQTNANQSTQHGRDMADRALFMNRKHCVFCLEAPSNMTGEHVWGDWVTSHLPRTSNKHNHANVYVPRPGEPEPAKVRIRAGDPLSSQVKVVCDRCNSGWLNRIQQKARPLLLSLFEGATHQIDADAQSKIAAWIAMATMTGEYLSQDEKRITVPPSDRDWLRAHSTAPAHWGIWIGRYPWRRAVPQWVHVSIPVINSDTLPDQLTEADRRPNTQTTAFSLGELFAFVMSSEILGIPRGWDWRTAPSANFKLHPLWPIQQPLLPWPPAAMTDVEAQAYPVAFAHYMDDLALRAGYRT
jgi:hypothetical protein